MGGSKVEDNIGNSIIVNESEFKDDIAETKRLMKLYMDKCQEHTSYLLNMVEEKMEGQTKDNLVRVIHEYDIFKKDLEEICEMYYKKLKNYVEEVDKADEAKK